MNDLAIQITGDKQVLRMFEELPHYAQERVLKPLMRMGASLAALEERAEAPTQSGLLQTSLGPSTLRTYGGGTLFITTGVRRGFRRAVQATSRGKVRFLGKKKSEENPELPVQDPVKYLHLVIGGRKAIQAMNGKKLYDARTGRFFGPSVAAAAPNPFMDRAFERAKTTVSEKITAEAEERIMAEASALLSK